MKLFLDIAHPKYFHSIKHFVRLMQEKGHEFYMVARDKDCTLQLLNNSGFRYMSRGKGSTGIWGRIVYLLKTDISIFKQARTFKPDIFISFGSPYLAHVAFLLHKPHVVFDDTDHNPLVQLFYRPFTRHILVPSCYSDKITRKHITFNSYLELAYLHPNYFSPNANVKSQLGVPANDLYAIKRFVSYNAAHDIGCQGINMNLKIRIINALSKYAKVFISSETPLPAELKPYEFPLPAEKMHDALAFAALLYGDSASMAAEAAVLGVPAVYIDDQGRGYTDELEKKYGLLFNYKSDSQSVEDSIQRSIEILQDSAREETFRERRRQMLNEKIDTTKFMVSFISGFNSTPTRKKI